MHVDLDAFYAAAQIREEPELRNLPLCIEERGMIMTANYKAREFGIRSGIPTFVGRRLCENLIFRRSNFSLYKSISAQFKDILLEIDPDLESCGLDEANLDVTDYLI